MLFIGAQIDEFNQFLISNFIAKNEPAVVCTSGYFDVLYPYAHQIYIPKKEFWHRDFVAGYVISQHNRRMDQYLIESGFIDYEERFRKIAGSTEGAIYVRDFSLLAQPYGGIYKFLFGLIADELCSARPRFIVPKEEDYMSISKEILKRSSGRPVLVVNGRTSIKHPARNERFDWLIRESIEKGLFVVDVTVGKERLSTNDYLVLDDLTYSEMASTFLCANLVVSIGNAGGITSHMLIPANFYVVQDTVDYYRGTWVDNQNFSGKCGLSIIKARQRCQNLLTYYSLSLYKGQLGGVGKNEVCE